MATNAREIRFFFTISGIGASNSLPKKLKLIASPDHTPPWTQLVLSHAHTALAHARTSPAAALAAFVCTFALSHPAKSALDVVCSYFQGNNTHGNEHGVGPMDTPEAACFDKLNVSLGMAHEGDRPMNLDSPIVSPVPWSHPDGFTDDVDAAPERLSFPAAPAGEEVTEDPKNTELRGEGLCAWRACTVRPS